MSRITQVPCYECRRLGDVAIDRINPRSDGKLAERLGQQVVVNRHPWRAEDEGLNPGSRLTADITLIAVCLAKTHMAAENPPSTASMWPFTKDASSEARNAAAEPTSSGLPQRPAGVRLQIQLLNSAFSTSGVFSSVAK